MTQRRTPWPWAINLGYALVLVIAAVAPVSLPSSGPRLPDWLAHAVAYGAQAALLFWALVPAVGYRRALAGAWIGASMFGVATETLQLLQPARSAEGRDLIANMAGALTVCGVIAAIGRVGSRGG